MLSSKTKRNDSFDRNRSQKKKSKNSQLEIKWSWFYTKLFYSKKSNFNQRKTNFKLGLANHIAINMVNEGIDEEKSRKWKNVGNPKKSKTYIVIIRNITVFFPLVGINIFMI